MRRCALCFTTTAMKQPLSYDAPSKVLGQFDSPLFRQTGDMLEKKMEAVIRTISDRTNQCVNQRNQVQQSKGNDVNYEKRKYQQQKS